MKTFHLGHSKDFFGKKSGLKTCPLWTVGREFQFDGEGEFMASYEGGLGVSFLCFQMKKKMT